MATVKAEKRTKTLMTFTGRVIDPFNMTVDDIVPLDIAHALSNQCRYNGHVDVFYSVGQHSCLVHDMIEDPLKDQAVLHDGSEYILGDVITCLKHSDGFADYRELEEEITMLIADRFDLPYVFDPRVKELDLAIREAEFRDLKKYATKARPKAKDIAVIYPWSQSRARREMIKRMRALGIKVDEYVK